MMDGRNENQTTLRLLYYPPIPPQDEPIIPNANGSLCPPEACSGDYYRCGAHCDYGTFTLLAQDCEGGLEVSAEPVYDLNSAISLQHAFFQQVISTVWLLHSKTKS